MARAQGRTTGASHAVTPQRKSITNSAKNQDKKAFMLFLSYLRRNFRYLLARRKRVWIDPSAIVDRNCVLEGFNKVYANTQLYKVSIGRYTYISPYTKLSRVDIGAFCSLGPRVSIGLGNHPISWISTHPSFYSVAGQTTRTFAKENLFDESAFTKVGNDVWIGANVIVLDGVRIGDGAVIAAGTVVTRDVRPYSVVAGVPAREIKRRFDDKKIEQLLKWQWWSLPEDDLALIATKFRLDGNWSVEEIQEEINIARLTKATTSC